MSDTQHWYDNAGTLLPQGYGLPSVTTIIGILAKDWLEEWKLRVGAEEAERKSKESREKGTLVHGTIERILKDPERHLTYPAAIKPYIDGFMRWFEKFQPTDIISELFIIGDGYAGRLDMLCKINGEWWIVDFKTSASFDPMMGVQLVAYADAVAFMENSPTGGVIPKVMILQLTDKIKRGYRIKEYEFNICYPIWEAILNVFNYLNPERKELKAWNILQ